MSATLAVVGKNKKPGRGRPKNPASVQESRLFIELDSRLKAALESYARKDGRTLKAQVSRILQDALAAAGFWPPKDEDPKLEPG